MATAISLFYFQTNGEWHSKAIIHSDILQVNLSVSFSDDATIYLTWLGL